MLRSAWAKLLGFALFAVVVAPLISGGCPSNTPTSNFPEPTITPGPDLFATYTALTATALALTRVPTLTRTPTPGFNFQIYVGTYPISASKTQDTGCNFPPSFDGQLNVTVNPNGSNFSVQLIQFPPIVGTTPVTRLYLGGIQQDGTFSASGTNTFFDFTATGTVTGQLNSGLKASGTETLHLTTGCPSPPIELTGHIVVFGFIPGLEVRRRLAAK